MNTYLRTQSRAAPKKNSNASPPKKKKKKSTSSYQAKQIMGKRGGYGY